MTVNPPYPTSARRCQAPWTLSQRLAWTWRRNPNYRHGRWSRYRQRLEARLAAIRPSVARYRASAPPYAPFRQEPWPTLGRYLPRRTWALARQWCQRLRVLRAWWAVWIARCRAGLPPAPPPVMGVLGMLFRIGRSPPSA